MRIIDRPCAVFSLQSSYPVVPVLSIMPLITYLQLAPTFGRNFKIQRGKPHKGSTPFSGIECYVTPSNRAAPQRGFQRDVAFFCVLINERSMAIVTEVCPMGKQHEEEKTVSEAAVTLGKLRWKGIPAAARKRAAKHASAARMTKISASRRSEIASKAAKSLTPEAAKERALKAWETKRKKLNKAS